MTATRYFEVRVTNCYTCPIADQQKETCRAIADAVQAGKTFSENRFDLTNNCPMAAQHKTESEMK